MARFCGNTVQKLIGENWNTKYVTTYKSINY